jgi:hypothetical protein
LHFALNKEEYQLRNDDIAGAKPDCFKFKSTREPSNPLNPQYKLASFTAVPPPVPKFVRDSISIADIEGSKTKPPKTKPERVSMVVRDIQGTAPKVPYKREQHYDALGYNDVYAKNWQSKRVTNPLDPVYQVRDNLAKGDFLHAEEVQLNTEYGAVKGSKPATLPEPRAGCRNLNTADIKGAGAGTKRLGAFYEHQRKDEPRNLTSNEDIQGTKPGSLKHAIQTDRITNPLAPEY